MAVMKEGTLYLGVSPGGQGKGSRAKPEECPELWSGKDGLVTDKLRKRNSLDSHMVIERIRL